MTPVIALALAVATVLQQQDSLAYSVAILPAGPYLGVEARLTNPSRGTVLLAVPPASGVSRTRVSDFAATDDQGRPLPVRRSGASISIGGGAADVRFHYRLFLDRRVPDGSTGAGFDGTRLYAVTRSLFVAPDPVLSAKSALPFPVLTVSVAAPRGWHVVAGWSRDGDEYRPTDGRDLLGTSLAAAPDFRLYGDTAGGARWDLAIRGPRYFEDSTLIGIVDASLRRSAAALGPVPVPRVTYTADVGLKGRTSGSLQGTSSIGLIWEPSEILELPRGHDTFHETIHLWFGGALETERWWTEGVTDYLAARLWAEWKQRPEDLATLSYTSLRNYFGIGHNQRLTMAEEVGQRLGGDNTRLLVYRKGMLAGLILDAAIRRNSAGRRTIDDASRDLLALASSRRSRHVTESEIREAVSRHGGRPAERAWDRVVSGRDLLTTEEVSAALREVTGRNLPPPSPARVGKVLRP